MIRTWIFGSFSTLSLLLGLFLWHCAVNQNNDALLWISGALVLYPVIILSGLITLFGLYFIFFAETKKSLLWLIGFTLPNVIIFVYIISSFILHARWLHVKPG
jgi:hypothetical protein